MVYRSSVASFLRRFLRGQGTTEQRVMDLSIGDGALWSIYSSITSPYIVPLAILMIGSSAPVGFITGIPVIAVPFSQIAAYRLLRRMDDLKAITIITTFLDRIPWIIIAILIFIHTRYFLYLLLGLLLMRSFFASFSGTTWTLWIPGMISEKNRDGYFSTRNMVMKAFGIVGYLIAIAIFISVDGYRFDYFLMFVISFIFSSLSISIMRFIPSAKVRDVYSTSSTGSTELEFILAVLVLSIVGFAYYFSQPYITLYLLGRPYLNLGSTVYTAVLIASGILYILSQKLGKIMSMRTGYLVTILITAASLAVLFLILYSMRGPFYVMAIVILMSIPFSVYSLASFNMMVSRSSGENRVKRTAYYTLSNSVALSAGPIVGNIAYDYVNDVHTMFLLSALILTVSIPLSIYLGRLGTTHSV